MNVKGNHPLAEIIAKKLFGISSVPKNEQDRMVNRACKEAVAYHKQEVIKARIEELTLYGCDCDITFDVKLRITELQAQLKKEN